jgi:hypothetical protein
VEVPASKEEESSSEAIEDAIDPGIEEDELEVTVASPPDVTPASEGNPNSPTLRKAGVINGLTVDVSSLTADFIELGEATDLDGDGVSVAVEI